MKMIFVSESCKAYGHVGVRLTQAATIAASVVIAVSALSLWGGYLLGERYGEQTQADAATAEMYDLLAVERRAIADAKAEQRAHLDALALKIAELQAHLMRLDALGDRLVEVGKLDPGEFDFSTAPPVGGVDESLPEDGQSLDDLSSEMRRIAGVLADREEKLGLLEQVLMNREVKAEVTPSGRPVKKGWMSSGFGKRTDPFNGKRSYHRGVDFAGRRGAEVVAVASGVVLRAKRVAGYGNVVEIRHADGYSTLYAHNKENLVVEGDVVSKGQTIALLGSTGRSSGPHVHFEVHRNGKIVDPLQFVRSAN
jgi:murein DD-endopeptidase MepM/ murein hydrolase activator NlpD